MAAPVAAPMIAASAMTEIDHTLVAEFFDKTFRHFESATDMFRYLRQGEIPICPSAFLREDLR